MYNFVCLWTLAPCKRRGSHHLWRPAIKDVQRFQYALATLVLHSLPTLRCFIEAAYAANILGRLSEKNFEFGRITCDYQGWASMKHSTCLIIMIMIWFPAMPFLFFRPIPRSPCSAFALPQFFAARIRSSLPVVHGRGSLPA